MPLHPQSIQLLKELSVYREWDELDLVQKRIRSRHQQIVAGPSLPVAAVRELRIPTPEGDIGARLYEPIDNLGGGIFVWFHGGGHVIGSAEESDDQTRAMAVAARCPVLSVDYRLAPEHPFPAAVHDAYAATSWAVNQAAALCGDGAVVAVGGESAGANLAAAVSLMARDRDGPQLAYQALIYPVVAMEIDTPSLHEFAEGYGLRKATRPEYPTPYVRSSEDARNPLCSPLLASSLAGLPPAMVITAEFDPLRDEGEMYAARLADEGVSVELHRYEGMLHGFISCGAVVDAASTALQQIGSAVGEALRSRRHQAAG